MSYLKLVMMNAVQLIFVYLFEVSSMPNVDFKLLPQDQEFHALLNEQARHPIIFITDIFDSGTLF